MLKKTDLDYDTNFYNKALNATEALQNFNAQKTRFL